MSSKGNCYDNATVEIVLKMLKSELIRQTVFKAHCVAEMTISRYIEVFYNPKCRCLALGFSSPIQFERVVLRLAV